MNTSRNRAKFEAPTGSVNSSFRVVKILEFRTLSINDNNLWHHCSLSSSTSGVNIHSFPGLGGSNLLGDSDMIIGLHVPRIVMLLF